MEEGMYINHGTLNISVRNISEFKQLLRDAEEQEKQLHNTINQLKSFDLKIDFENKKETC